MKLSAFITGIGRPVAYYPGLKKITGSTTAGVLLCQLLYWNDKTDDGWIWKNSQELEEETGLTYNEQRTARKILTELNLIVEENKKLDHSVRFRVNVDVLNSLWEDTTGNKSSEPLAVEDVTESLTADEIAKEFEKLSKENKKDPRTEKRGDLVDGVLAFSNTKGIQSIKEKDEIKSKISVRLRVNPDNRKWEDFINFAYKMKKEKGEGIDKFIDYAIAEGFNPIYWTPDKMKTLWPQAFAPKYEEKPFISATTSAYTKKEEVYSEMPKELGRKRDL